MAWEDITDDLTPRALEILEVGQLLRFDYEGSSLELKIVRKTTRKDGSTHVFAKKITTHDPDEVYMSETDENGHVETMNMGDMF